MLLKESAQKLRTRGLDKGFVQALDKPWTTNPPRNPQEPPRNPQEGGGVFYLDSPSLNVALREIGYTFLGFFMFSSTPPSINVALREV